MRATFVKSARKDYPEHGIKKHESYYWWSFRFGGKHYSKTEPKRSQLTQSSFYSTLYDLEDDLIGNLTAESLDELQNNRDEIVSAIDDLISESQDSLDNMPEQLQESSPLTERIDNLENWKSEIESIHIPDEPDEGEVVDEVIESLIEEIQQTAFEG